MFIYKKIILKIWLLCTILSSCIVQNPRLKEPCRKLIICGSNKVLILGLTNSKKYSVLWQWQPTDSKNLPEIYQLKYFNKIDECKPSNNGKKIMITSSTGGVAIIDKKSKGALFYSKLGNPHSIEELSNGLIAVALSNHIDGNKIVLFDENISNSEPVFKDSLFGGHGLYWDKTQETLYALGQNKLRTYKLLNQENERPFLKKIKEWTLPDSGGHDLVNYNSKKILLTTNNNVWLFNKELKSFEVFKPLENAKNVKGISINNNNRLTYIKPEESWWSHHIYLTNPNKVIAIPSINLYKVRWWNFN